MSTSTWIWIIVAIVAAVVVIALVAKVARGKRTEHQRNRAHELREQAAAHETEVQRREAHARETEAKAAQARAEADRKQAEADRLEAEARDRGAAAEQVRHEHQEHLRKADELDPDVDTEHEAYAAPGTPGHTEPGHADHSLTDTAPKQPTGSVDGAGPRIPVQDASSDSGRHRA